MHCSLLSPTTGPAVFDVPVSFAPASPAAYPQLTLDPAGPYTDGQQVTVTVQGWPGSIGQRPDLAIAQPRHQTVHPADESESGGVPR